MCGTLLLFLFLGSIMPIIQSCCCWRSLRRGCYASAIYTMVSYLTYIIILIIWHVYILFYNVLTDDLQLLAYLLVFLVPTAVRNLRSFGPFKNGPVGLINLIPIWIGRLAWLTVSFISTIIYCVYPNKTFRYCWRANDVKNYNPICNLTGANARSYYQMFD